MQLSHIDLSGSGTDAISLIDRLGVVAAMLSKKFDSVVSNGIGMKFGRIQGAS